MIISAALLTGFLMIFLKDNPLIDFILLLFSFKIENRAKQGGNRR